MSHTVTLETYHVIDIPLVTSGLLTFSGAVISQTANAARNTLSLNAEMGLRATPTASLHARMTSYGLIYISESA